MKILFKSDQLIDAKYFAQYLCTLSTWPNAKNIIAINVLLNVATNSWEEYKQEIAPEMENITVSLVSRSLKDNQLLELDLNLGDPPYNKILKFKENYLKNLAFNFENYWLHRDSNTREPEIEDFLNLIRVSKVFSAYKYISKPSVGQATLEVLNENNILNKLTCMGICKKLNSTAWLNLDMLKIIFSYLPMEMELDYDFEGVDIMLKADKSPPEITSFKFDLCDWINFTIKRNDVDGIMELLNVPPSPSDVEKMKKWINEAHSLSHAAEIMAWFKELSPQDENIVLVGGMLIAAAEEGKCDIIEAIFRKIPNIFCSMPLAFYDGARGDLDVLIKCADPVKLLWKAYNEGQFQTVGKKIVDRLTLDKKKEVLKKELSKESPNYNFVLSVDTDLVIAGALQTELLNQCSEEEFIILGHLQEFILSEQEEANPEDF